MVSLTVSSSDSSPSVTSNEYFKILIPAWRGYMSAALLGLTIAMNANASTARQMTRRMQQELLSLILGRMQPV